MGTSTSRARPPNAYQAPFAEPGSDLDKLGQALNEGRSVEVMPDGKINPVAQTGLGTVSRAHKWFLADKSRTHRRRQSSPVVRIHIPFDQLRAIETEAAKRKTRLETGGALLGFRATDDDFVVRTATGPGPNAQHEPASFTVDAEHVQAVLDPVLEHGTSIIGAWHSHPGGPPYPSRGDVNSMKQAVETEGAHPFFCQIIVIHGPSGFEAHGFIFEKGRLRRAQLVTRAASGQFQRLEGIVDTRRLAGKNVLVIGLGSGGSFITSTLAQAGVGGFLLVDPDTLEEGNIVRHAAGLQHVGQNKAHVMAELVRDRNPEARVFAFAERFGDDLARAKKLIALADLVICGVDLESSRRLISRLAREANKDLLVPGAYAGAVGGDIIYVQGNLGPCYLCSLTRISKGVVSPEDAHASTKADYGAASSGLPIQTGLGADVQLIATIAAKWAIRILDPSPQEGHWSDLNLLVWGNRDMTDLRALSVVEWGRIPKDPRCTECATGDEDEAPSGISLTKLARRARDVFANAASMDDPAKYSRAGER